MIYQVLLLLEAATAVLQRFEVDRFDYSRERSARVHERAVK